MHKLYTFEAEIKVAILICMIANDLTIVNEYIDFQYKKLVALQEIVMQVSI